MDLTKKKGYSMSHDQRKKDIACHWPKKRIMACRDYHFYNWNCAIPILEQNSTLWPKKRNFHPLLTIYIIILYIYYNSFEILGNLRMFFIPPHLLYSFIPIQTSNKHFHYAVDKKKITFVSIFDILHILLLVRIAWWWVR